MTVDGITAAVMPLLLDGMAHLKTAGLPSARHDAERLLASLLGTTRLALYIERDRPVDPATVQTYDALIARRARHEPLQYLLAQDEFFGIVLNVRPGVFIPRPETELLVERVLASLPRESPAPLSGVDLGTGTGCVALALCHRRADLRMIAVDRSGEAVRLARENAERLGLGDRVEVREGDLWEGVRNADGGLDLIVSNPPYIARELLPALPREVREYEPLSALDGGPGGTEFHKRIIEQAPAFLKSGGLLALELGLGQADTLRVALRKTGVFTGLATVRDLAGIERVLTARRT